MHVLGGVENVAAQVKNHITKGQKIREILWLLLTENANALGGWDKGAKRPGTRDRPRLALTAKKDAANDTRCKQILWF